MTYTQKNPGRRNRSRARAAQPAPEAGPERSAAPQPSKHVLNAIVEFYAERLTNV